MEIAAAFASIKRWYEGETKMDEFKNDPNSSVFVMPLIYTEYHWTARIARSIVGFYFQHWKWLWPTAGTVLAACAAFLALK